VNAGDILVAGHAKGETPMTPEEKLCAQSSAKRRPTCATPACGTAGLHRHVVEVRVFKTPRLDKDQRALAIERAGRASGQGRDTSSRSSAQIYRVSPNPLHKMAASGPKGMAAETKSQAFSTPCRRHQWWQIGLRNEKAQAEIEA